MEKKDKGITPTFDQLPSLVASLSSKVDRLVKQLGEKHAVQTAVQSEPMRIDVCAEYLTMLEGRTVTRTAVYSRVHKGRIPYSKNGSTLYFLREDITEFLKHPKRKAPIIEQVA